MAKACLVDDCGKKAIGRGWCAMHYSRWRRNGDVHDPGQGHSRPKPQMQPGQGVQCRYCGHWYRNASKLGIHCNRVHRAEMPVGCDLCDRRFETESGKQIHMGYAHAEAMLPRRDDPMVQREWNLRTKYGIGVADYERMLAGQGGRCATCPRTPADEHRGRLAVDHDHVTGAVRGLLCANCNRAIGLAADDPARLRRMADYLDGRG